MYLGKILSGNWSGWIIWR